MKDHLQPSDSQTLEEAYKAHTPAYTVCFIDHCPLHDDCMHWLCGQYADTTYLLQQSVNVRHPLTATDQCPLYRKEQRVVKKRGMVHFYDQMTGLQEKAIRSHLISIYNRKGYYQLRNGVRLITPADQQQIADVCRLHGWQGPLSYDGEQTDWLW